MQVRDIRSTLGMTQLQLARRAVMDARLVRRLEADAGDPQLSTLKKVAAGLECELVVRLVPRRSLVRILQERAKAVATQIVRLAQGTAALEHQEPSPRYVRHQVGEVAETLLEDTPVRLWDAP